jgi:hypothetical protein
MARRPAAAFFMRRCDPAIRPVAPASQERWYFLDRPKVARRKTIYFEKCGGGTTLNCKVLINSDMAMAIVLGGDDEINKGFSGANPESQAITYLESLGYVQVVYWQLPSPAN